MQTIRSTSAGVHVIVNVIVNKIMVSVDLILKAQNSPMKNYLFYRVGRYIKHLPKCTKLCNV